MRTVYVTIPLAPTIARATKATPAPIAKLVGSQLLMTLTLWQTSVVTDRITILTRGLTIIIYVNGILFSMLSDQVAYDKSPTPDISNVAHNVYSSLMPK